MTYLHRSDSDRILNITNGDCFNNYFISKFGGEAIPFCEVMMDGETISEIYSDDFVRIRSAEIGVSIEEYKSKMQVYDALSIDPNHYSELRLWFGKDTFCQTNLLMLLAYLEQIDYKNSVTLNLIDDESFEILEEKIKVSLGIYKKLYDEVLVSKNSVQVLGVLSKKAFDLYFDYRSREGKLARLVIDNPDKDEMQLVCLLIENSSEYGLSDIQARGLVKKYKV